MRCDECVMMMMMMMMMMMVTTTTFVRTRSRAVDVARIGLVSSLDDGVR